MSKKLRYFFQKTPCIHPCRLNQASMLEILLTEASKLITLSSSSDYSIFTDRPTVIKPEGYWLMWKKMFYSWMNNQAYMDVLIAFFWSIYHYPSGEAAKQKAYKK
jgi:hypothetical protein